MSNTLLVPAALLLAGGLLVAAFTTSPRYANPDWRNDVPDLDSEAFYRAQEAHLTTQARCADAGVGLLALGASLLAGFVTLRVHHFADLRHLKTPSSRLLLLGSAAVTWLAFVPAEWWWLRYTLQRGDYPWWGDSIAIPMAGAASVGATGLPVVLAGLAVCLWRARLPAPLWLRPTDPFGWFSTVVLGCLAAIALLGLLGEVLVGNPLTVPLVVVSLYLVLCGHAAAAQGWHAA